LLNLISAKEYMTQIIQLQLDDSSYDEILKELAFARLNGGLQMPMQDERFLMRR
jgi:hypothetical protein